MLKQNKNMHIYLGSDHAGVNLKKELKLYLEEIYKSGEDNLVLDLGVFTNDATEYLDIEREVCEKVLENPGAIGVVFSANGEQTCTLANKTNGIKAVLLDKGGPSDVIGQPSPNLLCFPVNLTDLNLIKKTVSDFANSKVIKK